MGHKTLEDRKKDGAYEEIGAIKKDLIRLFSSELHTKGVNELDAKECGEVADMIKDLAEAEKACMEAYYYETVVKAMEEAEAGEGEQHPWRMGYNPRRYASGRYAPKGRGTTRMGYMPYMDTDDPYYDSYAHDPMLMMKEKMNERFGYPEDDSDRDPRQSMEYNEYKRAKRHYMETQSPESKKEMDDHAMKHVKEALGSFRELWKDADPAMRKRMKADLTALLGEMPT